MIMADNALFFNGGASGRNVASAKGYDAMRIFLDFYVPYFVVVQGEVEITQLATDNVRGGRR
jgi:hypothetical protein